jgi:hypothetical protein
LADRGSIVELTIVGYHEWLLMTRSLVEFMMSRNQVE